MDEQQRNLIIAIALSLAILFAFQFFFARPKPPQEAQPAQQATSTSTTTPAPAPQAEAPGASAPIAPATTAAQGPKAAPRAEVLARSPRVPIATPRLSGSIDLVGARLDDLTLLNYNCSNPCTPAETADPSNEQIVLLAPDGTEHPYFAQLGWVASGGGNVKLPGPDTRWTSDGGELSPGHPVELKWDNGEGLVFLQRFAVDANYMFTVTQSVENHGTAPVTLVPFARVARLGDVPVSGTYLLHEGPIGALNGRLHDGGCVIFVACDRFNYTDMKKGDVPASFASTGGWIGFTDKYWLTALIPEQQQPIQARLRFADLDHTDIYQAEYTGSAHTLQPNDHLSVESRVFAGAKELALLENYQAEDGIPLFDHAIDFGWFYWITKPIFLALDFFYHLIGNFGLAIMLLTVIIKLLFFPLANKSYRAMSKMKLLQPEIQKLRERFGDDKQRLNQEMMALYKRVGANPMAGCLPIAIQIPVFFSLYKVLYVTIEMRHAPFYGWIHDLSAPDPTTFVNLFGLLPFTPPPISFLHIGAWPLIMGCTMFLQQKLNPQPPDPMQAKMFMILPVVFTFMLAPFAAGLVIYWSWNNLLSIAQQWVIMRRAGVRK